MRPLIGKMYDRLGIQMSQNEKHFNIFLRMLVGKWACRKLKHPECLKDAKSQFSKWMNTSNPDHENP